MSTPLPSLRRRGLVAAGLAGAVLPLATPARAQGTWPTKPIRFLVGHPAGGTGDITARAMAQQMTEAVGQPVLVENRPGANGNVAGATAAKSAPDGYTLAFVASALESVNPVMYGRNVFDPEKELIPVAAASFVSSFLVVPSDFPASNVDEFVRYARANGQKMTFGSPGAGSTLHLVCELFKRKAGFQAVHVPYKGAAPALQDLLGGQLSFLFDPGISFQHVQAGKLKMLAVSTKERFPLFPQVPTLTELGYAEVAHDSWFGIYAPAGTPAEIVRRINQLVNRAVSTPAVRNRLLELGGGVAPMSPEQYKALVAAESAAFQPLVRSLGLRAE